MNSASFFIRSGETKQGPYLGSEISTMFAVGLLKGDETVHSTSGTPLLWEDVRRDLSTRSANTLPPSPSGIHIYTAWDPRQLALLGILFTPLWSAAMAVANARRTGVPAAHWTKLSLGCAWLAADLALASSSLNAWPWHAVLLMLALWLLWQLGLREQLGRARELPRPPRYVWTVPLATGALGLIYIAVQFLVVPLRPIPAELVCEQMLLASDARRTKFLTAELAGERTLINWLTARGGYSYAFGHAYVVRDGGVSPAGKEGQCCVDFDFSWRDRSGNRCCGGFFTLAGSGRPWRVKDMHFTEIDNLPCSMSIIGDSTTIVKYLEDQTAPTAGRWTQSPTKSSAFAQSARPPSRSVWDDMKKRPSTFGWLAQLVRFFVISGAGKKLFAVIAFLIMGKIGFERWRSRNATQQEQPTSEQSSPSEGVTREEKS